MATSLQRQHAAGLMRWLLTQEPKIGYVQRRPMGTARITEQELVDGLAESAGVGLSLDCSEMATLVCRLAGLGDPNGNGYNGAGYTGTMLAHLPHYSEPAGANVGALCVWGAAPGNHVATVLVPGADPMMFSHGSQSGPKRLRFSTETEAQRRMHGTAEYTFLSVAAL